MCCRCVQMWFPCVDLNDLTAITPKQALGDNSCSFGRAYRLMPCFPEKTFAAHSVSLPCRWSGGACECTAMSKEQASFYVIKKISLLVQREHMVSLLIWPWVLLLWLFIGPWLCFCAEETPAVSQLPADRPDSWTHGWMAAHPIKPAGAHMLRKRCEGCVCVWQCIYQLSVCVTGHISDVCVQMCVFLCALNSYWLIAVWWELKLSSPEKCGLIEGAGRQNLLWLQTAGQSMPLFQYMSVCMWECVKKYPIPTLAPWGV